MSGNDLIMNDDSSAPFFVIGGLAENVIAFTDPFSKEMYAQSTSVCVGHCVTHEWRNVFKITPPP